MLALNEWLRDLRNKATVGSESELQETRRAFPLPICVLMPEKANERRAYNAAGFYSRQRMYSDERVAPARPFHLERDGLLCTQQLEAVIAATSVQVEYAYLTQHL